MNFWSNNNEEDEEIETYVQWGINETIVIRQKASVYIVFPKDYKFRFHIIYLIIIFIA